MKKLSRGAALPPIYGNDGNEYFAGTPQADTYYGFDGADTLRGQAGDDVLNTMGYSGNDSLDGGDGNDSLYGGLGNDTLLGGKGNDKLWGNEGNDRMEGGDGNDSLYGGAGNNTLSGGAGKDYLNCYGQSGKNLLDGGDGDDSIYAGSGNDTLLGGAGNDLLEAGSGNDTLRGGEGADTLQGSLGNDVYYLDDRGDFILDDGGQDTAYVSVNGVFVPSAIESVIYTNGAQPLPYFISGLLYDTIYDIPTGGAPKTISYSFALKPTDGMTGFAKFDAAQQAAVRTALSRYAAVSGVKFQEVADNSSVNMRFFRDDLASGGAFNAAGYASPGGGVHVKTSYSNLTGGDYGFQILLHEIGHTLYLKHPFEAPVLPAAEDTQQNTVMTYNNARPFVQDIGLFDLAAIQYLYGVNTRVRAGNDTYSPQQRYIWDGGGVDTLSAAAERAAVHLDLAEGSWNWVGAKAGSILAAGQSFIGFGTLVENATGGRAGDVITGNAAANVLDGGAGRDTLAGGAGNDTLMGGTGTDRLSGGAGQDVFRFSGSLAGGASVDTITDFNSADDVLQFDAAVFTRLGPAGPVARGAFVLGTAARDADDRLIYTQATGELRYDADGSGHGAAVLLAKLGAGTVLAASDLFVV